MSSPYVVEYSERFSFPIPPEEMWQQIQRFEEFESWWPWFRASHLEGEGMETGSAIVFKIVSRLPYEMSVRADINDAVPAERLDATISGDLEGNAKLSFAAVEDGTEATVEWDVEIQHAALRVMAQVGGPVVRAAHDWAVRAAVSGFRRHIAGVNA